MGRTIKIVPAAVAVLAAAGGLWWYWSYSAAHPSTDDAYLQADILTITSEVSGRAAKVAVIENQRVSAGDVLFTIDPASYEAQRDIASAQLEQAGQATGVTGANVAAAQTQVQTTQAAETIAFATYHRQRTLFDRGDVAQAALDQAATARDQATGAREASDAALASARASDGRTNGMSAARLSAEAAMRLAQIDVDRITVTAPADGWIANISLRPGQFVTVGEPQFSLVEGGAWWIDANFKETDLQQIRPGQPARIRIDMYPGTDLTGHVASLGAGSGASFSLLPAQNATGNWVKVTQRFPVRITLDAGPADRARQMRVGASVTVSVDTEAMPVPPPSS